MIGFGFTVPGRPVPWQRTASYHGRRITPTKTRDYQKRVGFAALAFLPKGWPLDARYSVEIFAKTTRRPDLDNIAKTVCDALNGIAWKDDRQVDRIYIERHAGESIEVSVEVLS